MTVIAFIAGLAIGSVLGILLAAIMAANRGSDGDYFGVNTAYEDTCDSYEQKEDKQ